MSNPAMKPTKPRVWYLMVFPCQHYQLRGYFNQKRYADMFVKHIKDEYGVQGKVVKVKECR